MSGESGIVFRLHHAQGETVLAACDEELLGRKLKTGSREYAVLPSFYGSTLVTPEELLDLIRSATIVNLLGKRVVTLAIKAGIISKDATSLLDGIKHAEIVRM